MAKTDTADRTSDDYQRAYRVARTTHTVYLSGIVASQTTQSANALLPSKSRTTHRRIALAYADVLTERRQSAA
jgi:hypothetical protein